MPSQSELLVHLSRKRPWFEERRCVSEFAREIDVLARTVPSHLYFNRDETKWLREAWAIAQYCTHSKMSHVQLNHDDPPDAFAFMADQKYPVEHAFAFEQGYRPGVAHSEVRGKTMECRDCSNDRTIIISRGLQKRIAEKAKKASKQKNYPSGLILIVDLNIGSDGVDHSEIKKEILTILAHQYPPFSVVRCLWNNGLY